MVVVYLTGRKKSKECDNGALLMAEHVSASYGKDKVLKDMNITLTDG